MTYYGGINAINVINPINATNHLCIFVPVSAIADRAKIARKAVRGQLSARTPLRTLALVGLIWHK